MKCSVCGSDNLEGSAYCEDCGSRLSMTPAAPVMAPAPIPVEQRGIDLKKHIGEEVPASVSMAPAPVPVAPAPVPVVPAPVPVVSAPITAVSTSAPASVTPAPIPVAPIVSNEANILCPSCGASNPSNSLYCEDCGASLSNGTVANSVPAEKAGGAPNGISVARPRLVVAGTQVEFSLDRESMLLGRNSPADNIFPEIDMTEIDTGSYISRRHGRITRQNAAFLYEDIGSSNGSFINGNKLSPNTQIELHDGDTLRLGRTEMYFRM